MDGFHFFRGHGRQVAAPFVGFDQNFIGNDVQFLLNFTLNVFYVGTAQNTTQGTFVDRMADAFASPCHHFEQQAQLSRNLTFAALLFNQIT